MFLTRLLLNPALQPLEFLPQGRLAGPADPDGVSANRPMFLARMAKNGPLDRSIAESGVARLLFWNPVTAACSGVARLNVTANGEIAGMGHIDYIDGAVTAARWFSSCPNPGA